MIVIRVGIYPIDLDRGIIFDLETFSAIVADLIRVKVTDLAFHTSVTLFILIQNAFYFFHIFLSLDSFEMIIPHTDKKYNFFLRFFNFHRTFVCNLFRDMLY